MVDTSYFIQQGSSNTLKVFNEAVWNVIEETWQGSQLLNARIVASYETKQAAREAAKKLNEE